MTFAQRNFENYPLGPFIIWVSYPLTKRKNENLKNLRNALKEVYRIFNRPKEIQVANIFIDK